jgi:threonine/homoserine/homoserine lactone efflux protein
VTLSPSALAALAGAMALLAAVPSISVLAVTARAASGGFAHGALTALGIVVADLLFIVLAIFGLVLLAETLGELFVLVRWLGAAWLVLLGILLWRAGPPAGSGAVAPPQSWLASFLAGLLLTLGDQKAILFYLGFLPAFVDLTALTLADAGLVCAAAILSVGGVKLAYAAVAARAGRLAGARLGGWLNRLGAVVLVTAGLAVALR